MKKSKKYQKFLFFVFCIFLFLFSSHSMTNALEVSYPTLATGAKVTTQSDFAEYLKYVFDIGIFIGFFAAILSLMVAGVLYFLSPIPGALAMARDRISGSVTGLLILALLYLIITTINPYLAIFKIGKLGEIPPPPAPQKQAGVYFYNSGNCSENFQIHTAKVEDFGTLKNRINSINIVHGEDTAYVAVVYDNINFWGKCQYINPNGGCSTIKPFTASASVYEYSFSPSGDGVYFYRKSFFDRKGGFYKIKNSQIKGIYVEKLENLRFVDPSAKTRDNPYGCTVPEEEQDCIRYDKTGKCVERGCPTLAGENISSMGISGNYFVLFVYFDQTDSSNGPWSLCQGFPTADDRNREGPKQIKWENIRNDRGKIPNYVVIIPVAEK